MIASAMIWAELRVLQCEGVATTARCGCGYHCSLGVWLLLQFGGVAAAGSKLISFWKMKVMYSDAASNNGS